MLLHWLCDVFGCVRGDTWKDVCGEDSRWAQGQPECIVCMKNQVGAVLVPCYHAQFCIACANRLKEIRRCPTCFADIKTPKRIFL
jgi:hypothetical protein